MNPFSALYLAQNRQAELVAESRRHALSSGPRRSIPEAIRRARRAVRQTNYPASIDVPSLTNYPYQP